MPPRIDKVVSTIAKTHSRTPPYAGILPRVFPYRKAVNHSEASVLCAAMTNHLLFTVAEDELWFAVTGHPLNKQDVLTLWLSESAAIWLLEQEMVLNVTETWNR